MPAVIGESPTLNTFESAHVDLSLPSILSANEVIDYDLLTTGSRGISLPPGLSLSSSAQLSGIVPYGAAGHYSLPILYLDPVSGLSKPLVLTLNVAPIGPPWTTPST